MKRSARQHKGLNQNNTKNGQSESSEGKALTGPAAPSVAVRDSAGTSLLLVPSNLGGRYVLLDFWASWCEPCRREMPFMKQLYEQYIHKGLQIIGISVDRNPDDWHKAQRELSLPWPNYLDTEKHAINGYGVRYIPFTVLINSEGHIVAEKLRGQELSDLLRQLFE